MFPTTAMLPLTPRARTLGANAPVLAPGVCLIAFGALVTRMVPVSDFEAHTEFALQLAQTGAMLPHFGYHALVVMVQALTPADWEAAAGIVTLGGVAACAVVMAWWLRGALGASASALLVAAATGRAGVNWLGRFALCGSVFFWHSAGGIQHLYAMWLV